MSGHRETYVHRTVNAFSSLGDDTALLTPSRHITGHEANAMLSSFVQKLADRGVQATDGVAVLAGNHPEILLMQLAIHATSGRLIVVPPELFSSELAGFLERADAQLLVTDAEFADQARTATPRLPPVLLIEAQQASATSKLRAERSSVHDDLATIAATADDIVTLFYTGGTWGKPKVVEHHHGFYDSFTVTSPHRPPAASPARTLVCTSVTHGSGHICSIQALAAGSLVGLIGQFDAATALQFMQDEEINHVVVNPPMLYAMLDEPESERRSWPSLETMIYTGAPASPARLTDAIRKFGPKLCQVYGTTETGGITILLPDEHDIDRPHTLRRCGRPFPELEVQLRQGDETINAANVVGEIVVRGPKVMRGYWRDPDASASAMAGGWFHTGDLGVWDSEVYLRIVGRSRDVIVTGPAADNVYCNILEEFLLSQQEIRDAVAIGAPDEGYSEAVHVFLVVAVGSSLHTGELGDRIVSELGWLYEPKTYTVLPRIPYTPVGKVDRAALRHLVVTRSIEDAAEVEPPTLA